jgi:hypothetical protein
MRMPSAAIAEANFDFADMARTTLGDHWRKITPQQQAQFVPLLTSFMENVYLRKLQEYSVQKVRQDVNASNISFIGQQSNGPGYAEVHSSVLLKDRPTTLKVDYRTVEVLRPQYRRDKRDGQLSQSVQPRPQQRRLPGARQRAAEEVAGAGLDV